MQYNKADSTIHRVAKRIRGNAEPILAELDAISQAAEQDEHPDDAVGDLEPTTALLQALLSTKGEDETTNDLLSSIFSFALEPARPPTPPPPTPPPQLPHESDHAKRRRKWEEREAAHRERLSLGRSTRGSRAVEKAFTEEAGLPSTPDTTSMAGSSSMAVARLRRGAGGTDPISANSPDTSAQRRPQKGVVAVESIAVLTDKERREAERGMGLSVEEVDEKQQLLRFNVGWVLPEGAKRHRTGTTSVTPSQSTWAHHHQPENQLSSTATSTHPLPRSAKAESSQSEHAVEPTNTMSNAGSAAKKRSAASPQKEPAPKHSKKAKGKLEKGGTVELESLEVSDGELTPLDETPVTERSSKDVSHVPSEIDVDDASPSPAAATPRASAPPRSRSTPARAVKKLPPKLSKRKPVGEDQFPPGTIVWAKWSTFPYFPAEIIDLEDEEEAAFIAPVVFDKRPTEEEDEAKGQSWLARFYDAHNTYAWLRADKLDMLGEDDGESVLSRSGRRADMWSD